MTAPAGPVRLALESILRGTFLGVMIIPAYVALCAAPVAVAAWWGGAATADETWRFIALVELVQAVPSIPGWAVAGAFVGLLLGVLPDSIRTSPAMSATAAVAAGGLAGAVCSITWYARAPLVEMACLGAALGIAAAVATMRLHPAAYPTIPRA